jgi:hypothetical protein
MSIPNSDFLCPTPRFHRRVRLVLAGLVVAGLGVAVLAATDSSKQEMTTNRVDAPPAAVTMPGMIPTSPQGAQALAAKPGCVSEIESDASCLSVKPRKPRMVRVATDRPALAAVAVGRAAPAQVIDTAPLPARAGSALAKASDTEAATANTAVSQKQVATPKRAKKTKIANRRAPRRDPYWYGAPSWREVEYQRGGYGRGGFTPNFW